MIRISRGVRGFPDSVEEAFWNRNNLGGLEEDQSGWRVSQDAILETSRSSGDRPFTPPTGIDEVVVITTVEGDVRTQVEEVEAKIADLTRIKRIRESRKKDQRRQFRILPEQELDGGSEDPEIPEIRKS